MNSTVLSIVIVLLTLAMNYCCYKMGHRDGFQSGMSFVAQTIVNAAPDLTPVMMEKFKQYDIAIKAKNGEEG